MPPTERLLTITQAAALLQVHPNTVRAWIRDGALPAARYGPQIVRIDPKDLDRLAEPYKPEN